MDITDKQSIYNEIQQAKGDGKALWSIAQQLTQQHRDAIKTLKEQHSQSLKQTKEKKEDGLDSVLNLLNDKQALRVRVMQDLLKGSSQQNAQASDKLAKIAGIESDISDLTVVVASFKDIPIDCPHCGENVHKPTVEAL